MKQQSALWHCLPASQVLSGANTSPPVPAGISAGDQPLAMVHELPLHSLTLQRQTGHAAPVTALAQHPQQPLAASLDANGLVLLWAVPAGAPLQPLGSLSELSGAAQGQAGATAVAWLDPAAGGTQLAVGGAHGVDIYGLSRCAGHAYSATLEHTPRQRRPRQYWSGQSLGIWATADKGLAAKHSSSGDPDNLAASRHEKAA